ncbi:MULTISPECIES: phage holin family protein [unclassified Thermosynechococcus]|uniref:phage holin family protein n=1 Tax=unclassified Thermosynechococcus TaxID=2622553 RepID=UPI0019F0120B|nr:MULTISPECIES: phage holin family protein [unclassified Thermosynechococcus]HIK35349.1 phage holin family protein [Thermosynechococcus sp. M98_K2018_005]HIK47107.1 phage holin family protein [Thermosynechococcus sp. M55_K2018_012]
MGGLLITWIVTSISLFIVSRLPFLGVEIDQFTTALWSAIVFGLLNATLGAILKFFAFPFIFLTFGLAALIINAAIFALAAALVDGFRLRNGFWSAFFGSIALSIVSGVCFSLLGRASLL